jgi:hypothetical protein
MDMKSIELPIELPVAPVIKRGDYLPCKGVSVYRGVLILWDEDFDARIKSLINQLTHLPGSLAVQERKATLTFFVRDEITANYLREKSEWVCYEDVFLLNNVVVVRREW